MAILRKAGDKGIDHLKYLKNQQKPKMLKKHRRYKKYKR